MELDDEDEAEGPVEVLAATWNVHSFVMCRTGQIAAEAVRAGIEVLLLQECSAACVAAQFRKPEWQAAYAGAPGDWMGNAVCVRGRARLGAWRKAQLDVERSALLASVAVAGRRLLVCCTHLDHQSEERRVRQLEALLDELQRESDSALGRGRVLLGGDLNALTRLDYSDARWAELQADRAERRWEACKAEVTRRLAAAGWRDLRQGPPVLSSRFATRVDYFWAQGGKTIEMELLFYGTLDGAAGSLSDHLPLAVRLRLPDSDDDEAEKE